MDKVFSDNTIKELLPHKRLIESYLRQYQGNTNLNKLVEELKSHIKELRKKYYLNERIDFLYNNKSKLNLDTEIKATYFLLEKKDYFKLEFDIEHINILLNKNGEDKR